MINPVVPALLPAGLMDVLPPRAAFEAATVERLVDQFTTFGYERIKPPLIEFEETLLAGSGAALTTETFRWMDPISQRMLALRPDMTMQAARIAASRLAHAPRPLRLSYAGQVMRVRGSQLRPERQLGQVGGEIFGVDAIEADGEVIVMALTALAEAGVDRLSVDLGLPTLVPAILDGRRLDEPAAARLRTALDRKDITAVRDLAPVIGEPTARLLSRLVACCGPADTALPQLARLELPAAAAAELASLEAVHTGLVAAAADLTVTVDPVENRGFEYHQGVTFALFSAGVSGELGRGGRYRTESGEAATGVTLFMDAVMAALAAPPPTPRLYLPRREGCDTARRLRREGWIVVAGLMDVADQVAEARRLGCTHVYLADAVEPVPASGRD
jgi:ATP phosphoribosyltransferase regulatory subunit